MEKKFFISLLFTILFLISFVSAQAPGSVINVNINQGYQLFFPQFTHLPENMSYKLHLHVSNISTGFPIVNTDVDCFLHLYNNKGNHTLESDVLGKDSNLFDHEIFLAPGNFTLGMHSYYAWCNDTGFGGEIRGSYEVTPTGEGLSESNSNLILGQLILLIAIFLALVYVGIEIEYLPFKIFLLSLAALIGMFSVGFSAGLNDIVLVTNSGVWTNLYVFSTVIILGGFLGILLFLVASVIKAFKKSRGHDFGND